MGSLTWTVKDMDEEDLDGEDWDGEDRDEEDRDQEMDGDGENIGSNKGGSIDDEYHDFYNEIYGKDGCYSTNVQSSISSKHGTN